MKCLILEDDQVLANIFCDFLRGLGHNVVHAHRISEASKMLRFSSFDLTILDFLLPDGNSIDLASYASIHGRSRFTILLTGSDAFPRGEHTYVAPGVDWVIRKPLCLNDLEAMAEHVQRIGRDEIRAS